MQEHMALSSVPVDALPGAAKVFGMVSLSGLRHQVDLTLGTIDALIIVECKCYRGPLPKNELLKFKAVTDDYYMSIAVDMPRRPVVRIFGGPGDAQDDVRRYAALHGIVLIERQRWPVPVVLSWDGVSSNCPLPPIDHAASLAWMCRPTQRTLQRQSDGSYRMPAFPRPSALNDLLAIHDRWSDRIWRTIDAIPGAFEDMLARFGKVSVA